MTGYNGAGLLATEPRSAKVLGDGTIRNPESEPLARMFIVAIGVNTYETMQLAPLEFPVRDVRTLAAALKAVAEAGRYEKPVEIIELTQENAVKAKIEARFAELAGRVRRQDALIVLLAGHGDSVAGRYFYYPADARLGGSRNYETEGIPIETWSRWIASVQVDKKLVIVDTCKSWEAIAAVRSSDAERIAQETMTNRIQNAVGHSVLTASRDAALEGRVLGHGVLTYAVLRALGADGSSAVIDVKAIDQFVVPEVRRLSRLLNREQQTHNKIGGDFPIGPNQSKLAPPKWTPVAIKPGKYVICRQVIVRSKPSEVDGSDNEILNESGIGCTEVQVVEHFGNWTAIARQGVAKGYVPIDAVLELN